MVCLSSYYLCLFFIFVIILFTMWFGPKCYIYSCLILMTLTRGQIFFTITGCFPVNQCNLMHMQMVGEILGKKIPTTTLDLVCYLTTFHIKTLNSLFLKKVSTCKSPGSSNSTTRSRCERPIIFVLHVFLEPHRHVH